MTRAPLSRSIPRLQTPTQHLRNRISADQLPARNVSTANRSRNNTSKPANAVDKQQQAATSKHVSDHGSVENYSKTMFMGRPLSRPADPATGVVPGAHVITVAKKYDIGFPAQLRRLAFRLKSNLCNIQAQYGNRHLFERLDMKWLDTLEHPFAGSVLERCIEWSDGTRPLWWSVNAYGNVAPFVCTTAQRRLSRGIRLALEEKGYDRFGRRLVEYGQTPRSDDPLTLFGTLRVQCPKPKDFCHLTSPDILVIGRAIVKEAMAELVGQAHQTREGSDSRKPRARRETQHSKDVSFQHRQRKPRN